MGQCQDFWSQGHAYSLMALHLLLSKTLLGYPKMFRVIIIYKSIAMLKAKSSNNIDLLK